MPEAADKTCCTIAIDSIIIARQVKKRGIQTVAMTLSAQQWVRAE